MSARDHITVLCGGASAEAEVSRVTGRAVADALRGHFAVDLLDLPGNALPVGLDPARTVVFPAMHGEFGEDGQLQALLEAEGIAYVGCDARSSALCMDKAQAKASVAGCGFRQAAEVNFAAQSVPTADTLMAQIGESLVLKPMASGSSVGVVVCRGREEMERALAGITEGRWMAEAFVAGREMTVGLLEGCAMGIVEIRPHEGVYDYTHKYTAGATDYLCPAPIAPALADELRGHAERAFAACGCRDFARLDFILADDGPYFLEINTIPGMTPTSLLPKSAREVGIEFVPLVARMVQPCLARARSGAAC